MERWLIPMKATLAATVAELMGWISRHLISVSGQFDARSRQGFGSQENGIIAFLTMTGFAETGVRQELYVLRRFHVPYR